MLVLCTLLFGVGLRMVSIPPAWAWLVAALAGVALAAGWGWARLWVAPFLPLTAIGGALILALLAAI